MKLLEVVESEWENLPSGDTEQELAFYQQRIKAVTHQFNVAKEYIVKFAKQAKHAKQGDTSPYALYFRNIIDGPLNGFDFGDVPRIEQHWKRIQRAVEIMSRLSDERVNLKRHEKGLIKAYRKQGMGEQNSSEKVLSGVEIQDEKANTPEKFKLGKSKITNPLHYCKGDYYVGPPEKWPALSGPTSDTFLQVQRVLKQAGVSPITKMYAGRSDNTINYCMFGADGKFIWRKSGTRYGTDNAVFFSDGTKIPTTAWLADNPVHFVKKHLI